MSEKIRAVIFDKDGTLHDTERLFGIAWRRAAEDMAVPDIETTLRDCTGRALPGIATYWAEKYPTIPFDEYLPLRQRYFHALLADAVPIKPGAMALLDYLRAHDYRLAVATSTPYDEAMDHLIRSDMAGYFDAVVGGDMIEHGKPAPDIYLLAAEKLGIAPAECIGVEDSINGILAVHAAGMRPLMVPDLIEPTAEIEPLLWKKCARLDELIDILESKAKGNARATRS